MHWVELQLNALVELGYGPDLVTLIFCTRRMHALLARYKVVPTAMSLSCTIMHINHYAVWHRPGKDDNIQKNRVHGTTM